MRQFSTEEITIGVLTAIGIVVLVAVFVWVVRHVFRKES